MRWLVGVLLIVIWLSPTPAHAQTALYRINAGGSAVTVNSGSWSADQGFTGGTVLTSSQAIAGTDDDALFQAQRSTSSGITYNLAVAAGTYDVTLYFAEITAANPATRFFDVTIEGVLFLDDFNIYTAAGSQLYTAVSRGGQFPVTDGNLTIQFSANARIAAIEVYSVPAPSATPTSPPAPSATPTSPPAATATPTNPPAATATPTNPPAATATPTSPPAATTPIATVERGINAAIAIVASQQGQLWALDSAMWPALGGLASLVIGFFVLRFIRRLLWVD
jgi:hypothetical protein